MHIHTVLHYVQRPFIYFKLHFPRVVLKVNVVDATGSLQLTMLAKDVEQLVGLSVLELWTLSNNVSILNTVFMS